METIVKRNWVKKPEASTRAAVFFGILLIVISSAPIFNPYLYDAHDLDFHLCRIEAIKYAIWGGNFLSVYRGSGVTVTVMHLLFSMGIYSYIFRLF